MERFNYTDHGPTTTQALQRAGFRLEYRHDGWYTNDPTGAEAFLASYDPTDDLKAMYWPQIRSEVEAERMKFITPGVAKAGVYQAKARECERYEADSNPQPENYPFLSAEIGSRLPANATLNDAYMYISETAAQWALIASMLEWAEGAAMGAISTATSAIEVQAVRSQLDTFAISSVGTASFECAYLNALRGQ